MNHNNIDLKNIQLHQLAPHIFSVSVKDPYDRALLFLRAQEYYESDSVKFRGKRFAIKDFIEYYKQKTKKSTFTYHLDFGGYNVSSAIIDRATSGYIADHTIYDVLFRRIVETIKYHKKQEGFYLIGIDEIKSTAFFNHELAHAFYYLFPTYKANVDQIIDSIPKAKIRNFHKDLRSYGYHKSVFTDEIQAYAVDKYVKYTEVIPQEVESIQKLFQTTKQREIYAGSPRKLYIHWT